MTRALSLVTLDLSDDHDARIRRLENYDRNVLGKERRARVDPDFLPTLGQAKKLQISHRGGYSQRLFSSEQIARIRELNAQGVSYQILGKLFRVNKRTIQQIVLRITYKDT